MAQVEDVSVNNVVPDFIFEEDSLSSSTTDTLFMVADTSSVAHDSVMAKDIMFLMPDNPALYAAWRNCYPLQEPSTLAMMSAALDDEHSSLFLALDSIPQDPTLQYAQNDLRMLVYMESHVPDFSNESLTSAARRMTEQHSPLQIEFENSYQRQLAYAQIQQLAIFRHTMCNMRSISRLRSNHADLPSDRKYIERSKLSGDEQVDTDLGLDLATATLNVEQVTFHADKWHRRGTTDMQISQTALSDNWYKGGDNNMTLSTYDKLVFSRYDESMKTTLDIALELRLSGYYTKADTIHPMRVNDNQFRVDVSYGYKAWKNWYYSNTAYIKTPIFEYFNANSSKVKSNFFSPLELNVAVGMELKMNKNKRVNYSLMLAPLSYNLKCVCDDRVAVTSYGIEEGKRSLNQVGASVTSKLEWRINESVQWTSRAYFFTSYHNTLLEFENTFNIRLGRYSSAKVYLYPRFDDGVDEKIQMKEMLTFGLAFAW